MNRSATSCVLAVAIAICSDAHIAWSEMPHHCIAPPDARLPEGSSLPGDARQLELQWNLEGKWTDITWDQQSNSLFGLRNVQWISEDTGWTADICRITPRGECTTCITISGPKGTPTWLDLMRTEGRSEIAFVTSAFWCDSLHVFKQDGTLWWTREYPVITRVRVANIDDDLTDELLVGTQDGLYTESIDGKTQWHKLRRTFIRDVVPIPAHDGHQMQLAVQYSDTVLAFLRPNGDLIREVRPKLAYSRIEARQSRAGTWEVIAPHLPTIDFIGMNGAVVRSEVDSYKRLGDLVLSEAALSLDGRWIAISVKNGLLLVYDAATGKRSASIMTGSSVYPHITWMSNKENDAQMLVVSSSNWIRAYELRDREAASPIPTDSPDEASRSTP